VVNNRKGRLIFFYDWSIELKWKATSKKSDPKPLKANGTIIIPNFSEENKIEEVEVSIGRILWHFPYFLCDTHFHTLGSAVIEEGLFKHCPTIFFFS
jgi:hypothetical protein